jgi:hypothetical protein
MSIITAENYKNATLLLPFQGEDNGTSFPDTAPLPGSFTAHGSAKTVTAQSKFYGSSAYFDGVDSYLTLPISEKLFFPGDFTIGAWVYLTGTATYRPLFDGRGVAGLYDSCAGLWNTGGSVRPDFIVYGTRLTGTTTAVTLNTWTHVEFCRSSGVIMAFVGGTKDATTLSYGSAICPLADPVRFFSSIDPAYFSGYAQDLYVLRDVALHTADFTPPGKLAGVLSNASGSAILDAAGDPAQRDIVTIARSTPPIVSGTAQSDTSGDWSAYVPNIEHDVIFRDPDHTYNDIIVANVTPV